MSKQVKSKEKSEEQINAGRRHNRTTRGINTRRRGSVWAKRSLKVVDKDGNEVEKLYEVKVPHDTLYDPWDKNRNDKKRAQEPFDALHLDWRKEMMEYVADNEARIATTKLSNGEFLYEVVVPAPKTKKNLEGIKVLFSVQSGKKFVADRKPRRRKRA